MLASNPCNSEGNGFTVHSTAPALHGGSAHGSACGVETAVSCDAGRQASEERATTDGTVPTRATLRIIPTPERRLLLRESLAAAVAAAAAAAERRGQVGGNEAGAPIEARARADGENVAAAGPVSAVEPAGGHEGVDGTQASVSYGPGLGCSL